MNPIIRGFHPDPSICRVGEDYYLVVSSFEYFPGLPIYHSQDLVNWRQIGNCVQRAEEFPLGAVGDSGGIWAPTIRYFEGEFYVTATLEKYGNFIISAKDPAGEWSSPVWVPVGGIDPSLYFEEGKAYYCTNQSLHPGQEEITLEEIDLETGALLGEQRTIWTGIGGGFLEAPHIYKVQDWYYLMVAEGGTNFNHMVTIARSRNILGPYEGCPDNPILTNVHDTSKRVQCAGHGDLFCDHNGNWWMVHLGIRLSRRTMSHLGRETFLTPIVWRDGWPLAENNRKAQLQVEGPLWQPQRREYTWRADFSDTRWEPEWIFLRKPVEENYVRDGSVLKLYPTAVTLEDGKNPTFAAIRQPDFVCEAGVTFSFTPECDGEEAGIAIMLGAQFYYRFCKRKVGEDILLVLDKTAEDFRQTQVICSLKDDGNAKLELVVRAEAEKYDFYYRQIGGELQYAASASTRFLACEVAGRSFTGTVMGLYTIAPEKTKSVMEVCDYFVEIK